MFPHHLYLHKRMKHKPATHLTYKPHIISITLLLTALGNCNIVYLSFLRLPSEMEPFNLIVNISNTVVNLSMYSNSRSSSSSSSTPLNSRCLTCCSKQRGTYSLSIHSNCSSVISNQHYWTERQWLSGTINSLAHTWNVKTNLSNFWRTTEEKRNHAPFICSNLHLQICQLRKRRKKIIISIVNCLTMK